MGIVRGGDSEYEEFEPSYEEKAEKLETILKPLLEENPSFLKLSGKYRVPGSADAQRRPNPRLKKVLNI